jgi:hypothetical protein
MYLTMDADSALSAVGIQFYMRFRLRSISKEMVKKFQSAAVCSSSSPLDSYSTKLIHFLYRPPYSPKIFTSAFTRKLKFSGPYLKRSFSSHSKQKDDRPKS